MLANDLQKSLVHANIYVDKSKISNTLNNNWCHWRTPWRKLFSQKRFTKAPPSVPQHYWQTRVDIMKLMYTYESIPTIVWNKQNAMWRNQNLVPREKYGGGDIMVWDSLLPQALDTQVSWPIKNVKFIIIYLNIASLHSSLPPRLCISAQRNASSSRHDTPA